MLSTSISISPTEETYLYNAPPKEVEAKRLKYKFPFEMNIPANNKMLIHVWKTYDKCQGIFPRTGHLACPPTYRVPEPYMEEKFWNAETDRLTAESVKWGKIRKMLAANTDVNIRNRLYFRRAVDAVEQINKMYAYMIRESWEGDELKPPMPPSIWEARNEELMNFVAFTNNRLKQSGLIDDSENLPPMSVTPKPASAPAPASSSEPAKITLPARSTSILSDRARRLALGLTTEDTGESTDDDDIQILPTPPPAKPQPLLQKKADTSGRRQIVGAVSCSSAASTPGTSTVKKIDTPVSRGEYKTQLIVRPARKRAPADAQPVVRTEAEREANFERIRQKVAAQKRAAAAVSSADHRRARPVPPSEYQRQVPKKYVPPSQLDQAQKMVYIPGTRLLMDQPRKRASEPQPVDEPQRRKKYDDAPILERQPEQIDQTMRKNEPIKHHKPIVSKKNLKDVSPMSDDDCQIIELKQAPEVAVSTPTPKKSSPQKEPESSPLKSPTASPVKESTPTTEEPTSSPAKALTPTPSTEEEHRPSPVKELTSSPVKELTPSTEEEHISSPVKELTPSTDNDFTPEKKKPTTKRKSEDAKMCISRRQQQHDEGESPTPSPPSSSSEGGRSQINIKDYVVSGGSIYDGVKRGQRKRKPVRAYSPSAARGGSESGDEEMEAVISKDTEAAVTLSPEEEPVVPKKRPYTKREKENKDTPRPPPVQKAFIRLPMLKKKKMEEPEKENATQDKLTPVKKRATKNAAVKDGAVEEKTENSEAATAEQRSKEEAQERRRSSRVRSLPKRIYDDVSDDDFEDEDMEQEKEDLEVGSEAHDEHEQPDDEQEHINDEDEVSDDEEVDSDEGQETDDNAESSEDEDEVMDEFGDLQKGLIGWKVQHGGLQLTEESMKNMNEIEAEVAMHGPVAQEMKILNDARTWLTEQMDNFGETTYRLINNMLYIIEKADKALLENDLFGYTMLKAGVDAGADELRALITEQQSGQHEYHIPIYFKTQVARGAYGTSTVPQTPTDCNAPVAPLYTVPVPKPLTSEEMAAAFQLIAAAQTQTPVAPSLPVSAEVSPLNNISSSTASAFNLSGSAFVPTASFKRPIASYNLDYAAKNQEGGSDTESSASSTQTAMENLYEDKGTTPKPAAENELEKYLPTSPLSTVTPVVEMEQDVATEEMKDAAVLTTL